MEDYLSASPVLMREKLRADNCAMCEYGMHYLFEILENKDDQEEIRCVTVYIGRGLS